MENGGETFSDLWRSKGFCFHFGFYGACGDVFWEGAEGWGIAVGSFLLSVIKLVRGWRIGRFIRESGIRGERWSFLQEFGILKSSLSYLPIVHHGLQRMGEQIINLELPSRNNPPKRDLF